MVTIVTVDPLALRPRLSPSLLLSDVFFQTAFYSIFPSFLLTLLLFDDFRIVRMTTCLVDCASSFRSVPPMISDPSEAPRGIIQPGADQNAVRLLFEGGQ